MAVNDNELQQPVWVVVIDTGVVAGSMTYDEARKARDDHAKATGNGGACVVTDKAAGIQKDITNEV